jgi:putative ABC transport system permease protein
MDALLDDVRVGARFLWKSRGFATLVASLLALGIGANTALFSLVNRLLLQPLPYPEPDHLVQVWESAPARGFLRFGVSAPAFHDWRTACRGIEGFVASATSSANLAGPDRPQRVRVARVAGDLVGVLGLLPLQGRTFRPEEEVPGRDAVVLLSEPFWRNELAADPRILGKTLTLDGVPHEITGVLPEAVGFPFQDVQVFKPLAVGSDERRGARWLEVFGRRRSGATLPRVRAEMAALAGRHALAYPSTNEGWTIEVEPLHEVMAGEIRPTLLLLWAAVGLVLLVAAANVAGLLLLRGIARQRDMAVRAALGAGRVQIARQVLTESVLLALLGGAGGIVLALGLVRAVVGLLGDELPGPRSVSLDPIALVFALLLSFVTGVLFGLFPAIQAWRIDLDAALRPSARGTAGGGSLRPRRFFVVTQVSIAVALLVGAGLVVRSFLKLLEVAPGFDARRTLTLRVAPPQVQPAAGETEPAFALRYLGQRDEVARFFESLLAGIANLPGVEAAGAVNHRPLTGRWWSMAVRAEGAPVAPPGQHPSAYGRIVSPGYFRAMGIPLRAGRDFTRFDRNDPVAIVSETFARRHWPGANPLGRRLSVDNPPEAWLTVVGIAADVRVDGLEEEAKPLFYVPLRQATFGFYPDWGMDLVVRTRSAPEGFAAAVRDEVRRLDPALPVFAVETMEARLSGSTARRRATAQLLGAFAVVALVLAVTGLSGLVALSVRLRLREMGVRTALGARPRDLVSLVLSEGLAVAAIGTGLGLAGALAGSRLLASFLYATPALDPLTFAVVAGLFGLVSLLACYGPARRAARLDPLVALRD